MEVLAAFLWLMAFLFGCVMLVLMCISVYLEWRILRMLTSLEEHVRQLTTAKPSTAPEMPQSEQSGILSAQQVGEEQKEVVE
ncbi:MAG: hypothetical protein RMK18_07585 [Armatimonadota bacterium]|nr:hypothetical protein [Armatimonadota bacterium]MCX7776681.1 hypothetical protein [Armatimonadota bacterium]MDW8025704.1 hypothetical protein [Armatimonadota bacterium]